MRRAMISLLAVALFTCLGWTEGGAQFYEENHYLVYEVPESYVVTEPIILSDQFNIYETDFVEFDKFANPVRKNGEPYYNPQIHQTWWLIDDPMPPCTDKLVGLDNQFGRQDWWVGDGRYLVLPAFKNMPGWPTSWNHYKCYDANGPIMDITVQLQDQFRFYDMIVTEPVLFCNPCSKDLPGAHYPIFDPTMHLAVYKLEPPMPATFNAMASDQFGQWQIHLELPIWLVVPSLKLQVIGNEPSTWGQVKSLYRN